MLILRQIFLLNQPTGISFQIQLVNTLTTAEKENINGRCNDLEKWYMERGSIEKVLKKQILNAWEHCRNNILEGDKQQMSEKKLMFNNMYYLTIQNVRSIIEELNILFTSNKIHKKVFPNETVIGFRNCKSHPLRITWLEPNYPRLRRLEDVNMRQNILPCCYHNICCRSIPRNM